MLLNPCIRVVVITARRFFGAINIVDKNGRQKFPTATDIQSALLALLGDADFKEYFFCSCVKRAEAQPSLAEFTNSTMIVIRLKQMRNSKSGHKGRRPKFASIVTSYTMQWLLLSGQMTSNMPPYKRKQKKY